MANWRTVKKKVDRDEALNLTELALATGYDRNTLGGFDLPLAAGKIPYSDYRRIMQARQDAHELSRSILCVVNDGEIARDFRVPPEVAARLRPSVSRPANGHSVQADADRFDAPSRKHAGKAASPAPAESRAGGSE